MSLDQMIRDYFLLLDTGEVEKAAASFEVSGRVNTPWGSAIAPLTFVTEHVNLAPIRRHEIMDVLISASGQSAAAHFKFTSKDAEGQDRPTFVGCDHFSFGPNGKIETLSVYCHSIQPAG